ncbi:hypothetical protein [Oceanobacillus sp. CFH 90083]|uniref:hypothetical protein n=1 Tax=Oceanobacillus sp. CFH 90083 TaxID=2592336 RepID=UPI00128DDEDB|nr:hypothetical protein [Oceanobacillus sp. CFH 90083]
MNQKLTIYSVLLLLLILGLGGCKDMGGEEKEENIMEMSVEELPDVTAFRDEFTREFMISTEPIKEGYYLFQSKTGGYTMMYPENARLDNLYYESPSDGYEAIQYTENVEEKEYEYVVRVTYNHGERANNLEELKVLMESRTNYNGEYETIDSEDKIINYATTDSVSRKGGRISYQFLGIIQSPKNNQSLSYNYNIVTHTENNIDLDNIEEEVLEMIESVEFRNTK